jgi:hypothetical protein
MHHITTGTPARLPAMEIAAGLARKLLRLAPELLRHALAAFLWLVLLPLLTSLLFQVQLTKKAMQWLTHDKGRGVARVVV